MAAVALLTTVPVWLTRFLNDDVLAAHDRKKLFLVTLALPVDTTRWPKGIGTPVDVRTLACPTAEAKRALLQWALAQNLEVEAVTRARHSLEDVLAKEVAKTV